MIPLYFVAGAKNLFALPIWLSGLSDSWVVGCAVLMVVYKYMPVIRTLIDYQLQFCYALKEVIRIKSWKMCFLRKI